MPPPRPAARLLHVCEPRMSHSTRGTQPMSLGASTTSPPPGPPAGGGEGPCMPRACPPHGSCPPPTGILAASGLAACPGASPGRCQRIPRRCFPAARTEARRAAGGQPGPRAELLPRGEAAVARGGAESPGAPHPDGHNKGCVLLGVLGCSGQPQEGPERAPPVLGSRRVPGCRSQMRLFLRAQPWAERGHGVGPG